MLSASVFAQTTFVQGFRHFNYDSHAALDVQEISVQDRGGASIHDVTYAGSKGGRVPAYVVVPKDGGNFAAILWGHWMMPDSATANRKEFLDEAIPLASAGVVSLLIDTPFVRPAFKADPDPLGPQSAEVTAQQVIDLRRGIDLLLSRKDVDPKRIAYVGHSFDSGTGAILDAVDKRAAAFVFMGGPQSVKDFLLDTDASSVAFRKSVPPEKLDRYLKTYAWADPGTHATHLGPAPALFQYAEHDEYVPVAAARHYFAMSSGPKEMEFYNSKHALDAKARRDRVEFLRQHLALSKLPPGTLEQIPSTK